MLVQLEVGELDDNVPDTVPVAVAVTLTVNGDVLVIVPVAVAVAVMLTVPVHEAVDDAVFVSVVLPVRTYALEYWDGVRPTRQEPVYTWQDCSKLSKANAVAYGVALWQYAGDIGSNGKCCDATVADQTQFTPSGAMVYP